MTSCHCLGAPKEKKRHFCPGYRKKKSIWFWLPKKDYHGFSALESPLPLYPTFNHVPENSGEKHPQEFNFSIAKLKTK